MKNIRYLFEGILLLILLGLSKIMPMSVSSNFGGWIGRAIGPRLAASRKAKRNIEMVFPDKSNDEVIKIVTGMWDNLGRVMMEYAHLKNISINRTEIVGIENIKNLQTGSLLVSAHMANWEVVPPALYLQQNFLGTPIYRAPNNPFSDHLLKKMRSINGRIDSIPKSQSGTRNIVKVLKNNGHIGMVIDQKYNEGIVVDFLGHPAMTSDVFAQLSLKYDVPILPIQIERLKGCHFRLTIHPPMKTINKTAKEIVSDSHILLKNWIDKNPEQWLWLHNRWKNKNKKG